MKEIVILAIDDWTGLYVNEKLVYQNHDVEIERVLEEVDHENGEKFSYERMFFDATQSYMNINANRFPLNLEDWDVDMCTEECITVDEMRAYGQGSYEDYEEYVKNTLGMITVVDEDIYQLYNNRIQKGDFRKIKL